MRSNFPKSENGVKGHDQIFFDKFEISGVPCVLAVSHIRNFRQIYFDKSHAYDEDERG